MLPIHEEIIQQLKRVPGINKLKSIPLIKRAKDKVFSNYLDNRRKLVQRSGYDVIDDVSDISHERDILIWIDWGTLLGLHREGKIIEHDYDLDFSTWSLGALEHKQLRNAFISRGYSLVREFTFKGTVVTETFEKYGVLFDIDYYFGDNSHAWMYSFNVSQESEIVEKKGKQYIYGMDVYAYHTNDLTFIQNSFHNGTVCLTPKDIERRVIEEYGENWKTPIKDYDWTKQNNFEFIGFSNEMVGWRAK